jgi:hypothetical protein
MVLESGTIVVRVDFIRPAGFAAEVAVAAVLRLTWRPVPVVVEGV